MIANRVKNSVGFWKSVIKKSAGEAMVEAEDLRDLADIQAAYREVNVLLETTINAALQFDEMKENQEKILENQREIIDLLKTQAENNDAFQKWMREILEAEVKS